MLPDQSRLAARGFYAALLLLLLVAVNAGCEPPNDEAADWVTVEDDIGRQISYETPPERLVSLAPSVTELIFAAGGGPFLVGVTTADDHPPPVDTLNQFSALPLDFESIVSLDPDLIFATDQVNTPRDAETFDALDLPVYFLTTETLDDVYQNILDVGALIETREQAQQTVDSLRQEIKQLKQQTAEVSDRPRVLFLIGDETLYAFGRSSHIHDLIDIAGGISITRDISNPAPTLSEEYVIDEAPDVIIGAFGDDYDRNRLTNLHPSWDDVPAIRAGRVYSLDPDIVVRAGPRLAEGARRMAEYLHPDLFELK